MDVNDKKNLERYKVGSEISYILQKGDNIPKGKKVGDKIVGKIVNVRRKGDDLELDIEWEDKSIGGDSGVSLKDDILKVKESRSGVDNFLRDVNIIKRLYLEDDSKDVYFFKNYKIVRMKENGRIILMGYDRGRNVFKVVKEGSNSYVSRVFDGFFEFLFNKKYYFDDEFIKKYSLENIFYVKFINNIDEFLREFYKKGNKDYKGDFIFNDVKIEYFIGIDEFGNQGIFYCVGDVLL